MTTPARSGIRGADDADVSAAPRSRRTRSARDARFGLAMITPALAIVVVLLAYPMGYALYMSTYSWNDKIGSYHAFVGLGNYAQLVTDPAVGRAMVRTAVFSLITVLGGVGLAVAIAVLLNRPFRGRTLVRVLLLVPWAIPPVVNGIMWKLIFDGSVGIMNTLLRGFKRWMQQDCLVGIVVGRGLRLGWPS